MEDVSGKMEDVFVKTPIFTHVFAWMGKDKAGSVFEFRVLKLRNW